MFLTPIGFVHNSRTQPDDDYWGGIVSQVVIDLGEDALQGIESFSHAEVIFYFDRVPDEKIVSGLRHPRNNPDWPEVGILAQRGKNRPNRLGLAIVNILERKGNILYVTGLDAIDGTPVLDVKPVMREFLPQGPVTQPAWATELMKDYWKGDLAE